MVSGCAAAASGGYTNVLIMPNTVPAMDGVKVTAGQTGRQSSARRRIRHGHRLFAALRTAHDVKLAGALRPVRMRFKGRAGKEATDVADWIGYLPEHDDEHKDAYQLCASR